MGQLSIGQREKALRVVRGMPSCSIGAAIAKWLSPATFVFRNCAAGNIGDFYERNRFLLEQPATDENIADFAAKETAFLRNEGGRAAKVGSWLTAEQRAKMIRMARDDDRCGF